MDSQIELRHLRYFVAVAEELHFGRAAQRLHLSQPPLSQQIRQLESIVGYQLLARTSRAVKLTSAGEVFLERARRTLSGVEQDLEEARNVARGQVGSLEVGFISSSMLTRIPTVLGRYRALYPLVQLKLHERYTSGVVDALLRGTLDVGITRDSGAAEGLQVEVLLSESFVAVLPSGHPLARRTGISAADLREEPFVFFPAIAGTLAYKKPISICEEHGFRPRVVQEAPQWLTLLRLVGAGLGVSIAPACVRKIAAPDVVCRPLKGARVSSDLELAYRTGEDRAVVSAFAAIARGSRSRR